MIQYVSDKIKMRNYQLKKKVGVYKKICLQFLDAVL